MASTNDRVLASPSIEQVVVPDSAATLTSYSVSKPASLGSSSGEAGLSPEMLVNGHDGSSKGSVAGGDSLSGDKGTQNKRPWPWVGVSQEVTNEPTSAWKASPGYGKLVVNRVSRNTSV